MNWDDSGEPFTAMVSPTSLNFNSVELHILPSDGKHPRVELGPVPHSYASILNEAVMVAGRGKNLMLKPVKNDGLRETFRLTGTMGKGALPAIEYASVSLPESHIAHVFAALLRAEGVEVEKDFGGASFAAETGEQIASLGSFPLLELTRLYNTYSNNFMTEQVFQAFGAAAMGGSASLEKSQQAMREFLNQRESCKAAVITNGSGLSWENRISAHCFVDTLQSTYRDFRVFADLMGSLPVGGQTGTLKNRFKRVGPNIQAQKVRAKTGTIWSRQVVTSLVGFTQLASGEQVAFALIENDQRNDPGLLSGLKDWEDKCVDLMQQLKL
jgi:PBP4 family serine-type D-alanyl-D-alanine carboxypeptidase